MTDTGQTERGSPQWHWYCDITHNPVGTDTRMVGAPPCSCQVCRASARIAELEKERDAAMAIIKKMLDDTKHFLSLSNGPQS